MPKLDRQLPHNDEAERALLGAAVLNPTLDNLGALARCAGYWFRPSNANVARAILAVSKSDRAVDAITVADWLRESDEMQLVSVLAESLLGIPSSAHATHYADIVIEAGRHRDLIHAASGLLLETKEHGITSTAVDLAKSIIESNEKKQTRAVSCLDLQDAMLRDPEPVPWLVPNWIAHRDVALVGGEPGMGKSLLTTTLAIALTMATPWLGCVPVARRSRVMICDEENNPRLSRHRMRQLLTAAGVSADRAGDIPLRYLHDNQISLDRPEDLSTLRREIDAHEANVLILDSLIRFHSRDENSNSDMAAFFAERIRPLTIEHDLTVILLHHLAKPNKNGSGELGHRLRGASDMRAYVDQIWGLEGDRATRRRTLTPDKNRWTSDLPQALALSWFVSDDGLAASLTAEEMRTTAEERIRDWLAEAGPGGMMRQDIVDRLEEIGCCDYRNATKTLGKMAGQGTVNKGKEGREVRYWLARFGGVSDDD